jgi:hypothetical protein
MFSPHRAMFTPRRAIFTLTFSFILSICNVRGVLIELLSEPC